MDKVISLENLKQYDKEYIQPIELKNKDQDLEIIELKHLVYDTIVDHVEATIENVDVKPIPDYFDQHKVIDGGEIMLSEILGKTEKWNQLMKIDFSDPSKWNCYSGTPTYSNNSVSIVGAVGRDGIRINSSVHYLDYKMDHVYLSHIEYKSDVTLETKIMQVITLQPSEQWTEKNSIKKYTTHSQAYLSCDTFPSTSSQIGNFSIRNIYVIDLTDIFGAGNEPTSVDDERIKKLIAKAKAHPEYDAGSLHSVMAENFKVNGANIWDEEWEKNTMLNSTNGNTYVESGRNTSSFIEVAPNSDYYFKIGYVGNYRVCFYDINKNYLGSDISLVIGASRVITTSNNCHYIRFATPIGYGTTYNHDICISLGSTNIGYKPYKAPFVLTLPQSVELNGAGDVHDRLIIEQQEDLSYDIKLERNFKQADLGTLSWNKDTVTVSGQTVKSFYSRTIKDGVTISDGNTVPAHFMSQFFTVTGFSNVNYGRINNSIMGFDPNKTVWVYSSELQELSTADVTSALKGTKIVYRLATPTTETLITGLSESQVATLLEKGGTIEIGNETMTLPDVKVWLEVRKLEA